MDSPAITASIASALDGLDFLLNSPCWEILEKWGFSIVLKELKMFILISTRNLDNQLHDPNLPSLLLRIEDIVHKLAKKFHPDGEPTDLGSVADKLHRDIGSLLHEVNERYLIQKDFVLLQLSDSLVTIDDISIIITSSLEVLEEYFFDEVTQDMLEQLKVLQSIVCFVDKPTQELLARAKNVAIHIYLHIMCPEALQDPLRKWMQTINPMDPMVSETYIQALSTSKFARQLSSPTHQHIDDGIFIATKNFLDSLISNLWKLRQLNMVRVLSVKDQILELYRKFRSLRTILKLQKPPPPPTNNMKADIVSLVHDAGVLIFSLYQTHTEVDLGCFHDLLKITNTILLQLGEKDPPGEAFNFPKTNQLGFVDFVLEKLVDLRSREAESTTNSKHVQTIHEELVSLRSFFGDIVEFHQEYDELHDLWNHVLEVAYKVESLIDHLLVGGILISSSTSVNAIMKDIMDIKLKIEVMRPEIEGKRQPNRLKEAIRTNNDMPL